DAYMSNGAVAREVRSRERREDRADGDADRGGDQKPCVALIEQYAGRRERMQREKASRGHEGERDIEQPGVSAAYRGITCGIGQNGRDQCRSQHQPEVGRVMLPAKVQIGSPKQQQKAKQWHRQDDGGKDNTRTARGLSHPSPAASRGTGGFPKPLPTLRQPPMRPV